MPLLFFLDLKFKMTYIHGSIKLRVLEMIIDESRLWGFVDISTFKWKSCNMEKTLHNLTIELLYMQHNSILFLSFLSLLQVL
jgi:hypothetical protein